MQTPINTLEEFKTIDELVEWVISNDLNGVIDCDNFDFIVRFKLNTVHAIMGLHTNVPSKYDLLIINAINKPENQKYYAGSSSIYYLLSKFILDSYRSRE